MSQQINNIAVKIGSFSFRKGYPKDSSDHGGGFVFDCRFIKNPGREEIYKNRTGRQQDVVEYLEKLPEAHEYFRSIEAIITSAINAYQKRGFEYLSVQFGCTGGQHRSVYFAERLAKQLSGVPGVTVEIDHRDCPVFEPTV